MSKDLLPFQEAYAYLVAHGYPGKIWSFRREVHEFPERFGAVRRNPLARRGRGGKIYFPKAKLKAYNPFQPVPKSNPK